jgi:Flp pilus assembly protein CpaB
MQPGDRVDVLASVNKGPGHSAQDLHDHPRRARARAQLDARVVAADGCRRDAAAGRRAAVGTVTLGVTPEQADC